MTLNEAPQETHGYSANQVVCGHRVRLPVDLIWPNTMKTEGTTDFVKKMQKKWKKVRKVVMPFNQREGTGNNPFRIGDKILVVRQKQEKDNKLTPNWKGPYVVTRIPTRHQVEYLDEDSSHRTSNIIYCKKYLPCTAVAYHKISVHSGKKKYTVQSLRDLERLVQKDRLSNDTMLTLTAQIDTGGTQKGIQLAKGTEGLFMTEGGLERWLTWKELQERCGVRSRQAGVNCDARRDHNNELVIRNAMEREETIDPALFFQWEVAPNKKGPRERNQKIEKNQNENFKKKKTKYEKFILVQTLGGFP